MAIAVIHQMSLRCSRPKARSAAGALALLAILLGCGGQPTASNQPPKTPPTKPGYFGTEPSHATFLPRSDAYCASAVTPNSYEPRPDNDQANHTVLSPPYNWSVENYWTKWRDKRAQVTGNCTGTTTEIIQWAACKWGIDEDTIRADAVIESYWHMSTIGRRRTGAASHSAGLRRPANDRQSASEDSSHQTRLLRYRACPLDVSSPLRCLLRFGGNAQLV
ncbi:MAG TPA: hypothetical protein VEJ00_05290 [Candidatus Acidoferrales bacterium]|nr:hypothetical protein [Candidatus Acidoferrales bacterium]